MPHYFQKINSLLCFFETWLSSAFAPGHHKAVANNETHCSISSNKDWNLQQNLPLFFPLCFPWPFLMQTHLGKVSASLWEQRGTNADMNFESGVTTAVICMPGIVSSGQARTQLQTDCGVTCSGLCVFWLRLAVRSLSGRDELISCRDIAKVH